MIQKWGDKGVNQGDDSGMRKEKKNVRSNLQEE